MRSYYSSLPTSTVDTQKQDLLIAFAATNTRTFHQQHRFYHTTLYCFI